MEVMDVLRPQIWHGGWRHSAALARGISSETSDQDRGVWQPPKRTGRDPFLPIFGVRPASLAECQ